MNANKRLKNWQKNVSINVRHIIGTVFENVRNKQEASASVEQTPRDAVRKIFLIDLPSKLIRYA